MGENYGFDSLSILSVKLDEAPENPNRFYFTAEFNVGLNVER